MALQLIFLRESRVGKPYGLQTAVRRGIHTINVWNKLNQDIIIALLLLLCLNTRFQNF